MRIVPRVLCAGVLALLTGAAPRAVAQPAPSPHGRWVAVDGVMYGVPIPAASLPLLRLTFDATHGRWTLPGQPTGFHYTVYVGDMDDGYLNLAVYRMEAAAAGLENREAGFTFEYGRPMKPHGWQPMSNAELIRMMDRFRRARAEATSHTAATEGSR